MTAESIRTMLLSDRDRRLQRWFPLAAAVMLLPVIAIASYGDNRLGSDGPAEMALFGPPGKALLLGDWASVFTSPVTQAGPFELLPYGLAELLGIRGSLAWTLAYCVANLALAAGLLAMLAPLLGRVHLYVFVVVGSVAVLLGFVPWAFDIGHPAQVMIPALWILAADAARRGKPSLTGVLLGVATGWEPWGVLGAPVFLCSASPQFRRTALAGTLTTFLIYGPFVLLGSFRMFDFAWGVSTRTLMGQLFPDLASFPWTLRLAQALVTVAAGCLVALMTRHDRRSVWLVPLAVLLVRLLLDPLMYPYYFIAPSIVIVAAAAMALARGYMRDLVLLLAALCWCFQSASRTLTATAAAVSLCGVVLPTVLFCQRKRVPSEAWHADGRLGGQPAGQVTSPSGQPRAA